MNKLKIKKFVCLALTLLIVSQNALCAKLYGDKTADFSLSFDAAENSDTLMLLKKLGIFDGEYLPEKNMPYETAAKIFMADGENTQNGGEFLTNEDFFRLCAISFGLKENSKENLKETSNEKLCDFYDFALCSAENKPYIAAYLESCGQYENTDGQKLLRPKNILTEREFFSKLSLFEAEIAKKYGFDVISGKISDISAMGGEKTISLTGGNDIVTKENDLFLTVGDKAEQGCEICVFYKGNTAYAAKITKSGENRFKTGGIYKGDVFLYDKSGHRIIFKNLKKYQKGEFLNFGENGLINTSDKDNVLSGKTDLLTEFNAFSNFLVYENYSVSSQDKINNFLLDREAVFFTMIDRYGEEKICYIIYVG